MLDFASIVGFLAAILGAICWLPQTIKVWRTKTTRDLSLVANILVFGTVSLWLIYGILVGSWPLILGNVISVASVGAIIVAILIHK